MLSMGTLTKEENDKITEEIKSETRKQFEKAGATVPKIAKELVLMGFSDIGDYVTVDDGGALQCKPFDDVSKKKRRAIKKIKEKTIITESKDGEKIYKTSTVEYELYDKLGSLKTMADIMGISAPSKITFPDKDGQPQDLKEIFSADERIKRINFLLEEAKRGNNAEKGDDPKK